ASVVPLYFVWIAPELFNFSLVLFAYFCWLYKEVAPIEQPPPPGMRWLRRPSSDALASVLLGVLTFSKVTNALLFPPIVAWHLWRREWRRAIVNSVVFALVAGGLFAVHLALTGDWNYQGLGRATFYA